MTIKTLKIIRVVRKSVFAGAVRVTAENLKAVTDWCKGGIHIDPDTKQHYIKIRVQHPLNARQTKAYPGDWVLQTPKGFKTFPNDAFESNFELVNPQDVEELMVEEPKKVRYVRNTKVVKQPPVYPNGKCPECGFGLMEDKTCGRKECESNHDY